MPTNFYMYFVAAIIPLLVGTVYYHPKVLGSAWMKSNDFTEESLEGGNMPAILGLAYFLGLLMCLPLTAFIIHQGGVVSSAMSITEPGVWSPEAIADINVYMAKYGNSFRSFGHGALHGLILSIGIVLPVIGINALFERRGGKYVAIHWGYWAITLMLMGGLLCKVLEFAPMS